MSGVRKGNYHGNGLPPQPLTQRFAGKFRIDTQTGCWPWTAAVDYHGYGRIQMGPRGGGVIIAPRASWLIHNGPIPEGMCVLHRCDNPPCVNPDHLWLGTRSDNQRDMMAKGRGGGQFGS